MKRKWIRYVPLIFLIFIFSCAPLMTKTRKEVQTTGLFRSITEMRSKFYNKIKIGMTEEEVDEIGFKVYNDKGERIINTSIVESTAPLSYFINVLILGKESPPFSKDEEAKHYIAKLFREKKLFSKEGRVFWSNNKEDVPSDFVLIAVTFNTEKKVVDRTIVDDPQRVKSLTSAWGSGITPIIREGAKKTPRF